MKLTGRFVRVFQWIAPVLMPVLVLFSRELLGARAGWLTVIIIVIFLPWLVPAMYVPAILTVFDRDVRTARRTRSGYGLSCWVVWASMIGMLFTLYDAADDNRGSSVLSVWWGVTEGQSTAAFLVFVVIGALALSAAIVVAIVGIVVSRRQKRP